MAALLPFLTGITTFRRFGQNRTSWTTGHHLRRRHRDRTRGQEILTAGTTIRWSGSEIGTIGISEDPVEVVLDLDGRTITVRRFSAR